jgi:Hsp20/alpha crystallin family
MMLMRTDPFRDLDRFTQQVLGTAARPAVMPIDAWRDGDQFIVELDLPGVKTDSLDLDVERNVLTVRAERPGLHRVHRCRNLTALMSSHFDRGAAALFQMLEQPSNCAVSWLGPKVASVSSLGLRAARRLDDFTAP